MITELCRQAIPHRLDDVSPEQALPGISDGAGCQKTGVSDTCMQHISSNG